MGDVSVSTVAIRKQFRIIELNNQFQKNPQLMSFTTRSRLITIRKLSRMTARIFTLIANNRIAINCDYSQRIK